MIQKYLFLTAESIFSLGMLVCAIIVSRKRDKFCISMLHMILTGFASVTFYSLHILFDNEFLGYFFGGLFYASIDMLLFFILYFCFIFTDVNIERKITKRIRIAFLVIAFVDMLSLICNSFSPVHYAFTLEKLYMPNILPSVIPDKSVFFCWIRHDKWPFTIHLLFSYAIVIHIFYTLIKKILQTQKFYRNKYLYLLSMLIVVIVFDGLFVFIGETVKINYSILLYALLTIAFYYITFHVVQGEIINKVIAVVSRDMDNGIICFDKLGNCIYINEKAKKIFYTKKSIEDKVSAMLRERLIKYSAKNQEKAMWQERYVIDGQKCEFSVDYRRLRDEQGKLLGSYMRLEDQTQLIKNYEEQRYKATHDSLTGLYTREAFFSKAVSIINDDPFQKRYLIATNIKNFKFINDRFDTETGDKILMEQAKMLKLAEYAGCIAGRISCDRFAMLINRENFNAESAKRNTALVQNILADTNYKINLNIGVYPVEDGDTNIQSMYDKAILALEHINSELGADIAFYDKKLMDDLLYEKNILHDFERAINNEEFCTFLHPQTNTAGKVVGAEALVRWRHPIKGLLPPGKFVPILERTGYIAQLDRFMWKSSCEILKRWKNLGREDLYISINISNKDFYFLDVFNEITGLVKEYDISPANLNLEITESALMYDINRVKEILQDFRSLGFKIEMDDFGTGFSSLNVLKNVKMDVLKIDMAFLSENKDASAEEKIKIENKRKIILRSLIKMAKDKPLNMTVITEGVETEEQAKYLEECGTDIYQGYYFSKPIYVGDFENRYLWGNA